MWSDNWPSLSLSPSGARFIAVQAAQAGSSAWLVETWALAEELRWPISDNLWHCALQYLAWCRLPASWQCQEYAHYVPVHQLSLFTALESCWLWVWAKILDCESELECDHSGNSALGRVPHSHCLHSQLPASLLFFQRSLQPHTASSGRTYFIGKTEMVKSDECKLLLLRENPQMRVRICNMKWVCEAGTCTKQHSRTWEGDWKWTWNFPLLCMHLSPGQYNTKHKAQAGSDLCYACLMPGVLCCQGWC